MQNRSPQTSELKALLAHIQMKMSPKKRLRVRAEMLTAEIIARARRESYFRK